ncbi:hypothetical protein MMC20_002189, partial [Loxospora ochrophaea]|nr:hypothetical protein [Loxospora ochrophaea]
MPTLEQNFLPCNHRLHTTPTLATVSIISGQARLFSADTNLTLKTTHDPTACLIRGPHRGDHVERQIPRATHPPKIKLTQKFLDCGHDAVWYPTSIEAHVPPSRGSSSRAGSLLSGGVGGTDAEAVWRAEVSYVD